MNENIPPKERKKIFEHHTLVTVTNSPQIMSNRDVLL